MQAAALRAYELGEPVLSSWLDPVAPAASSHGTSDKDLVQRHSEKCKQLRVAHAARNELELQIAQLHAIGPQAVWRQRALVAEAAAAAAAAVAAAVAAEAAAEAAAEVARLREECQQWSQHWQGLRTLLQAGELEDLRRALDTPPSDASTPPPYASAAHPLPKPAFGSTVTLPTAPATAGALAARVRPEAPQPHASRAACIAFACKCTCCVGVPTVPVRRTTPCIPQVAIDMEAATPCAQAATPCILQVVIGVEAEVTLVRMQPVLASWCGKAAIIEEGGLSKEAEAEARVEAAAAAAAEARVEAAAAAAAEARVEAATAAEARVEAAEARVEAAVAARLSHSGGPLVATSDAISPYPMQSHHLELPRSIVGARSSGEAPADEARPTATPMASDPPARSSAQAAGAHRPAVPAAEAAIPIAPPLKTTAAGVVVPALNVGNTDDFLSRLAAAESGERGSSSR